MNKFTAYAVEVAEVGGTVISLLKQLFIVI